MKKGKKSGTDILRDPVDGLVREYIDDQMELVEYKDQSVQLQDCIQNEVCTLTVNVVDEPLIAVSP